MDGGWGGWGVPMSHVDYKKWKCRPVEFKKTSCRPVEFKKTSCRLSLKPKMGRVPLSILGVYNPSIVLGPSTSWVGKYRRREAKPALQKKLAPYDIGDFTLVFTTEKSLLFESWHRLFTGWLKTPNYCLLRPRMKVPKYDKVYITY